MTEAKTGWTAIILAGQRPGIDPLADAFGETFKALVPVGGRPMVTHVVETVLSVPGISKVVILCQQPDAIRAVLPDHPALTYIESQSGISQSILTVAGTEAAAWPLFVTDRKSIRLNSSHALTSRMPSSA